MINYENIVKEKIESKSEFPDIIAISYDNIDYHLINMRHLDKDSVIVDAGACYGNMVDMYIRFDRIYESSIYAIEPSRYNCDIIRKKKYKSNVKLFEYALVGDYSKDKKIELFDFPGHPKLANIFEREFENCGVDYLYEKYEVKKFHINDIFSVLGIDHIDYLKMDVESTEHEIITSMDQSIADNISQMSIEMHSFSDDSKINDVVASNTVLHLNKLGFKIINASNDMLYCFK